MPIEANDGLPEKPKGPQTPQQLMNKAKPKYTKTKPY